MSAPATQETPPKIPGLRFDSLIGRGGMSVVWRAWHREMGRFVAVKVLDADFATNGRDIRQFMTEVRTATSLDHPGIVRGYGADCVDGRYYLIMDWVDGYSLASLMERKGRIGEEDALIVIEAVADAMIYAWRNFRLVHCDIKPENLMVARDGGIRILDMGLCQSSASVRSPRERTLSELIGSPAYISPERIYADVDLDCRADIYSLGASIYHLVTGRMLFPLKTNDDVLRAHVDPEQRAPDPRNFAPALSEDFVRLLAGMLVKDRDWRYPTWYSVFSAAAILDQGGIIPPLPTEAVSSVVVGI